LSKHCMKQGVLETGDPNASIVEAAPPEGKGLTSEVANAIEELWKNPEVSKTFEANRTDPKFWQLDEAPFFFDNVQRFVKDGFDVTAIDKVKSRTKTTGVVEVSFLDGGVNYTIIDVGGQRSERRKWIQCFENVQAVVFVSSLTGYASVLYEDEAELRLTESLNLFREVTSKKFFSSTPIFLWLTKVDLFTELITKVDLKKFYPYYNGPANDTKAAIGFFVQQFNDVFDETSPGKLLKVSEVSALNSGSVREGFQSVQRFT